jgi:3-phenylpropionate/trans-cinnamate dioxygenase ferredoxin subunit
MSAVFPLETAVVVPVGSILPERDATLALGGVDAAVANALELLERHPSTNAQTRDALHAVAAAAAAITLPAPASTNAPDAHRAALAAASPAHLTDDEFDDFATYDAYFGVSRAALDARDVAFGLLQTLALACTDAADAMLGRDELLALLRSVRAMFERIGSVDGAHDASASSLPLLPTDDAKRITMRWRLGHHLFAYCAMFARDALAAARAALPQRDAAAVASALALAGVHARAKASAMWYTSEFPIAFYLDSVRPTMENVPTHVGFSGSQNADFRTMQWERERAVEDLFETFGTDAAAWPSDALAALMTFNEMEIQAAELHVLVAASKVRLDRSLAQKALAHGGDERSAVAALREKVAAAERDVVERFTSSATRRLRACAVSDVPLEHPFGVTVDGQDLVIVRAHGAIWACAATCTHAGGDLAEGHLAGSEIVCPMHGGKFDPRTGAAVGAPARDALETYAVDIDGLDVYVELP